MRALRTVLASSLVGSAVGCALLIGEPDAYELQSSADASDAPVAPSEAAVPPVDATVDGAASPSYSDITQSKFWTSFDLSALDGGPPAGGSFASAGFDGRYVYFFQDNSGVSSVVLRYDTNASFTSPAAYATFDLAALDPAGPGIRGAVYVAPYLYLVPGSVRTDGPPTLAPFFRYDPRSDPSFSDKRAWTSFDLHAIDPNLGRSYWGGTSDGTYVYLTSWAYAPADVIKYRANAEFTSPASYEALSVATLDTVLNAPSKPGADAATGHLMSGAVFDGRYVTYPPAQNADYFVRYDTKGTFGNPAQAWAAFDVTQVVDAAGGNPTYFFGGAFDGRYTYYHFNRGGVFVRFDNQGSFTDKGAWTFAQPPITAPGTFIKMGVFDGRYVYPVGQDTLARRYDTTKDFTAASSYETFDLKTLFPALENVGCAVFDGRYVYFSPYASPVIFRFDARQPAALPPTYYGSAF